MNLKRFDFYRTCYYFDDIIKFEDFNFDIILINKMSHGIIFIDNTTCRILVGAKPVRISFEKIVGFIRVDDGSRLLVLFGLKNMMLFKIGLDTL